MIRGFLWAGRRRDGKTSGRACGLNRRTRIGIGTGPHRRRPVSDNRPRHEDNIGLRAKATTGADRYQTTARGDTVNPQRGAKT